MALAGPALNRVVADFKCAATGDQTVHFKSLRGKKVVLYFYPKDATPGCTAEGQDFRDLHAKFRRHNSVVFGGSRDSVRSHEKFRDQQKFPFELLSDPDEKLCRQFDVIRESRGMPRRYWTPSRNVKCRNSLFSMTYVKQARPYRKNQRSRRATTGMIGNGRGWPRSDI